MWKKKLHRWSLKVYRKPWYRVMVLPAFFYQYAASKRGACPHVSWNLYFFFWSKKPNCCEYLLWVKLRLLRRLQEHPNGLILAFTVSERMWKFVWWTRQRLTTATWNVTIAILWEDQCVTTDILIWLPPVNEMECSSITKNLTDHLSFCKVSVWWSLSEIFCKCTRQKKITLQMA